MERTKYIQWEWKHKTAPPSLSYSSMFTFGEDFLQLSLSILTPQVVSLLCVPTLLYHPAHIIYYYFLHVHVPDTVGDPWPWCPQALHIMNELNWCIFLHLSVSLPSGNGYYEEHPAGQCGKDLGHSCGMCPVLVLPHLRPSATCPCLSPSCELWLQRRSPRDPTSLQHQLCLCARFWYLFQRGYKILGRQKDIFPLWYVYLGKQEWQVREGKPTCRLEKGCLAFWQRQQSL